MALCCLEKIRWSCSSRHLIAGCVQHCAIGDLDQRRTVKTVKRGAQARAICANLTDLDPIAFRHIIRQYQRPMHYVSKSQLGPKKPNAASALLAAPFRANQPGRKPKIQRSGIGQRAIYAVIHIEHFVFAQLHLHDN